jgi:hypothetical protein
MAKRGMKVEGVKEAERAFDKVEDKVADLSKAHKAEVDMLLSDVRSATRQDTGTLVSGWHTESMATEGHFLNDVPYAGVQEYGWAEHNIEPTNAIASAFENNVGNTETVYADAIREIGESAGFNTK